MDLPDVLVGIGIALIGAITSIAAGRAAARASMSNARTDAEKEAYSRARNMDVATIERQDREIAELQEQNRLLRTENETLLAVKDQNYHLNADVKRVDKENRRLDVENKSLRREVDELRKQLSELLLGRPIHVPSQRVTSDSGVATDPMIPEVRHDEPQDAYPDLD